MQFEALMINEFKGLKLRCVDGLITPRGPGYPTNVSVLYLLAAATCAHASKNRSVPTKFARYLEPKLVRRP